MNPTTALENLVRGYAALDAAGATPFLVDGTLLGCIRENGFIPHDKDVDLGAFISTINPARVTEEMAQRGMKLDRTLGTREKGFEMSFVRKGIRLDVFAYYSDDKGHFHAAWDRETPIRYRYWPFHLRRIEFLGHLFNAPDDPDRFLATKYGPTWTIPDDSPWDWAWGPKNAELWR